MTTQEFKIHLEKELRHKLKCDNEPTPILDRLELHLKDFDEYDLTDLLNPKNMKHDLYTSFLFQICFPSRIKMDIDAEYTPIKKKRVAIVNCKNNKQQYTCSADEMYSASHHYRAQRKFFLKAYDDYYIISSEYGIIHHSQIIKPYDRIIVNRQYMSEGDRKFGWEPETISLIKEQLQWMKKKGWEISFHTTKAYYDILSDDIRGYVNYIKQPHGMNLVPPRYGKAIEMLEDTPLEECLEFIGHREDKPKGGPVEWYHPQYPSFFGTPWELTCKYKPQQLQDTNLTNVRKGTTNHHRGWVTDESLLPHLYQTDSGQWRIKK